MNHSNSGIENLARYFASSFSSHESTFCSIRWGCALSSGRTLPSLYWSPAAPLIAYASFSIRIDTCSWSCAQFDPRRSWLSSPIASRSNRPTAAIECPLRWTTYSSWGKDWDGCTTSPCTPGWTSRTRAKYTCDTTPASNWWSMHFSQFCSIPPAWRVLVFPPLSRGCAGGWVWAWGSRTHRRWRPGVCWRKASRESDRHSGTL